MSRTTKWKLEKMKVKVVFRLQFHATHIPQTGWDKLSVSFIPVDLGKVTAKTSKSHVRNGTCKWGDPIYETTRLLQDTKTKQYDEKLYKLVVAMGSSRSSLLGEANINLADFADASKPSAVSLPLCGCSYESVLHVTVQLLTSKTGFREFEQQTELRERGLQTSTHHNARDGPSEKVNSKVRFHSESSEPPSLGEVEMTEDYADSGVGIDDISNTSESLCAEKHGSSTHENESLKSTISGDLSGIPFSQSPRLEKGDPSDHRLLAQGANDWVHGWSSDYSVDNDLVTAYEENSRLRGSLEMAESSILELKLEISSLQSHADELGVETQKCSQILAKEIASGEELAKEIFVLKSECSKFKDDFEQFKHSKSNPQLTGREIIQKDWVYLFQDLQMRWLQGLLTMEDKVSELHNKASLGEDERDFSFLNNDLKAFQHIMQDLRQDTINVTFMLNAKPTEQANAEEIGAVSVQEPVQFVSGDKLESMDKDQKPLEGVEQVSQEPYPLDAMIALREKITELQRELEESKAEQVNLARKLDQMECYYEAFIHELEENQKQMLEELQNLRNEHSSCLFTIASCNTQMEKMHEDMNEQLFRLSEERRELESVNNELEKRAISSETALERARWNSSIAVDQLQKDLELLSFQVLSMFKTNENLIKEAFADASQSCFQEYPEESLEAVDSCLHKNSAPFLQNQYNTRLQGSRSVVTSVSLQNELGRDSDVAKVIEEMKNVEVRENVEVVQRDSEDPDSSPPKTDSNFESNLEILDSDRFELLQCQNQNTKMERQLLSGKILLENCKKSLYLQEDLYQKAEAELVEMYLININLIVFSKVLEEAFGEASNEIKLMKEKMNELTRNLAQSTESEELLMLRLQTAQDDINTQRAFNETWSTKCDELTLQNQILEDKVQDISNENGVLTERITEFQRMITEQRTYESKYEVSIAENTELVNLLKKETAIKRRLQDEVSCMGDELKTLKAVVNEQSAVNGNLEETRSYLGDKLGDLRSTMISYCNQINDQSLLSSCVLHEVDSNDLINVISHLDELQGKTYEKILQLTREKSELEKQRDTAEVLVISSESELSLLRNKYEIDVKEIVNKLDVSNALVDKLQLELENVSNKLEAGIETEVRYAEQVEELSTGAAGLEAELQNVTKENRDLAQKILAFECLNEELERTKLTVINSARENQALVLSLRSCNEQSAHLSNEFSILKEQLRCVNDELNSERSLRVELAGAIADVTYELKIRNDQLISFEKEKAEVVHLKQLVSDLELEKSRVCHLLLQNEVCIRSADENASFFLLQVTDLETQLTASHEYFIAADVELICTRHQLHTRMQELVQQLESIDGCYRELHLKHLDVLTTLNGRISSEAQFVEENAKLLRVLDSLRSELEKSGNEKNALVNQNNVICAELEEYKIKEFTAERNGIQKYHQHECEIEQLKHLLFRSEELIDNLRSSRDEREITVTVLRSKLEEQRVRILSLEECENGVMILRNQKCELSQRLSEQILKTEEFKNLSLHLKELKDKAEAECLEVRDKREIDVPSVSMQDSLKIAFIREQCETKVQELRNQLYVSKKHGEEMLLKLNDVLNEVENRRKGEASHVKRNEELLLKILELETELQLILGDKREKAKYFDKLKAELECSLISLDCCREEKQKLQSSLQDCNDERTKNAVDLTSMMDRLKILASSSDTRKGEYCKACVVQSLSTGPVNGDAVCGGDDFQVPGQDGPTFKSENGISRQVIINQEDLRQLALINEHFKSQSLKSSMEHLHEELERMKSENLVSLPLDVHQFEPVFHGLQRQLLQLHKANEQLGNIFPLFNEFPGSGNAFERVLALEIELAEALQAKKKSKIHFQSSFLKQHTDEEAVFQSFRDINELIKDMLELKGRYVAVETELKEMHDRYSELSLQFAEVEGERQKLVMTLKNARSPKKASHPYRSTSASLEDHP
ncbi:hypothetical protein IFM89_007820 [Coptis chinensis]|uniref:C2 NT-type domain-containing protein n=1 Tax=Coptis chinensis TaxID=261450 RepID=A0A835LU25_9MAGN|nr:hypothetical protein IFM89_007820 [Coptis chinensis]